jgi:DNA-binding MarR family transcriptional regulator
MLVMLGNRTSDVEKLTGEIRHLFQVLKTLADSVHRDAGLNASTRAVLEALADGPRTVPDIARRKSVTRQHIQSLVDELASADLVELRANPAHLRSPLVALARKGEAVYAGMRKREAPLLDRLAAGLDARKTAVTIQTLAGIRRRAEELIQQQEQVT